MVGNVGDLDNVAHSGIGIVCNDLESDKYNGTGKDKKEAGKEKKENITD